MKQTTETIKIGLAITGASGFLYGYRLLQELIVRKVRVHLTLSPNAVHIARIEHGFTVNIETGVIEGIDDQGFVTYHHHTHVGAAPASGSYGLRAIIVAPCSMGTLGRIATGTSEDLIGRMADVAMKERRPLIIVPRETPYSTIQLRNMLTLSEAGAIILPASPGFYHKPQSVREMVDFVVARILQHVGLPAQDLVHGGWGEEPMAAQRRLDADTRE